MTKFIQARNYTQGRIKRIRLIVWHDMEAPEAHDTAENVARWFAGANAPRASAHVCCDDDSVVECVKPGDTAWHAPNANADGYGVELAGYRDQGAAGWRDDYSLATIRNAAAWLASLPELAHIPDRWLTDAEVADRQTAGHTTHEQVSRVFNPGGHTDPGPDFPADYVIRAVAEARGGKQQPAPSPPAPAPTPAPKPTPSQRSGEGFDVARLPTLQRGSTGHPVRALQRLLNDVKDDGAFGPATEASVKRHQKSARVTADGIVGPASWAAFLGAQQ